jgi:hypothetical protein
MRLFHTTAAASAILRDGFRDGEGDYGLTGLTLRGVFLASYPVDANQGARGIDVLEVVLPDDLDLSDYAIAEEGIDPWEWCVPAALLNEHVIVRLLTDDDD